MTAYRQKTVLITGASSGIGMASAIRLAKRGYKVYCAARRLAKMEKLKKYGAVPVYMDVTDETSVKKCVSEIISKRGRIDVLINSAGYGLFGPVEDISIDDAKAQLDVNLFGLAYVTKAVIPYMRKAGGGKIINISSVAGRLCVPLSGWYSCSKYAVEALSDSLRFELKPFNIDVIVIQPGGIASDWHDIMLNNLEHSKPDSLYADLVYATDKIFRLGKRVMPGPDRAARKIECAVCCPNPKTRYRMGLMSKAGPAFKAITTDKAYDKIIRKLYSIAMPKNK